MEKAKVEVIPFGSDNVFSKVSSVIILNFFSISYISSESVWKK